MSCAMEERLRSFKPTSDQINALPEGIRRYIHDLETFCDPAGITAENTLVKDNLEMFGVLHARLMASLDKESTLPMRNNHGQ